MKKLLAMGLAVGLGAATLTATTAQPAKADGGLFLGGLVLGYVVGSHHPWPHHSWHGHWHSKHVWWCENHYRTYNRYTDLYYYRPGKQRHCVSPYR